MTDPICLFLVINYLEMTPRQKEFLYPIQNEDPKIFIPKRK